MIAAVIALVGCHGSDSVTSTSGAPAGALTYKGYDASGRPSAVGWIWLDLPAGPSPVGTSFTGTWEIGRWNGPGAGDVAVPSGSSNELYGEIRDDGTLAVLTHDPDNDFYLLGALTFGDPGPVAYAGTWTFTGIGGTVAGTFAATRP